MLGVLRAVAAGTYDNLDALCQAAGVRHRTYVSRIVAALERKGYLECRRSPAGKLRTFSLRLARRVCSLV